MLLMSEHLDLCTHEGVERSVTNDAAQSAARYRRHHRSQHLRDRNEHEGHAATGCVYDERAGLRSKSNAPRSHLVFARGHLLEPERAIGFAEQSSLQFDDRDLDAVERN